MATNKNLDLIFDYGDVVKIKPNAPIRYKPGLIGTVCGIRTIDNSEIAQQFDQTINSELYLIEFKDGQALEVPQLFLMPYPSI